MYPYLYVTKRGVLLGLEGLYRVKGTLVKIHPISGWHSIRIASGFLKRYVTPLYLKRLRNGSWSKLEVKKNPQYYFIKGTFFSFLNFD